MCLQNSALPNSLPREVNVDCFAKQTEKSTILGNSLDKELENSDDHSCPKIRDLVDSEADEEKWIC